MKIGIDATALVSPQPTGVEVVTRELLRALLELDRANLYLLYTPRPLDNSWSRFSHATNRVLPPKRFWVLTQLAPAILEDQLDVFWSPSNLLPSKLPAKTLATIHDLATVYFPQAYSWKTRLLSWITLMRAAKATKVIAVSQQTKTDFLNRFKLKSDKVVVIPNALPHLPEVQPGVSQYGDYILTVGRVEARKNPVTAIKAFALIAPNYPKLKLVFAGSMGYQADAAKELVKTVGLEDRVEFLGFVNNIQLANLYLHAKLVLFPSLYEGFGLPVLEAFHYGIPVVASNTPAVAEVAGNGALLINPVDALEVSQAIVRLLEEPELRARLIEQGTERLNMYSWESSAAKLLQIINSL